jgi:hypothetical protein
MSETQLNHARTVMLAWSAPTAAVRELAGSNGWRLAADWPRGQRMFRQLTWRTGSTAKLHYAEDHLSGNRFLLYVAETAEDLDALGAQIEAALPVETPAQVLDRLVAATEPSEIITVLLTYGAFSMNLSIRDDEELDPRLVPLIARLVEHPVKQVRRAAYHAAVGLSARWPEVAAPVLARQGAETDLADLLATIVDEIARRTAQGEPE